MASTLHKLGGLSEDITTLAQLPSSSSHQSEEYEPLKTEVAPNNNASSKAVGTLQIRLTNHKIPLLSLLSLQNKTGIWVYFLFRELCSGADFSVSQLAIFN